MKLVVAKVCVVKRMISDIAQWSMIGWFVVWHSGRNSICTKLLAHIYMCTACVLCMLYNDLFSTSPISLSPHWKSRMECTYSYTERSHNRTHTHMCWSNSFCIVSISISFNKAISIHLRCIFVNCNAKMVWTINDCGRWKIRRKCANKQIIERNKCLCYLLWIRILKGKNALNSFAWRCNSISLCCKIH